MRIPGPSMLIQYICVGTQELVLLTHTLGEPDTGGSHTASRLTLIE